MTKPQKAKVLLVDDFHVALLTEQMLFRNMGDHELLFVSNGAKPLDVARAEHRELILMDIVMPEMNGVEACRAIRSEKSTRDIPIIKVTTRAEEESNSEAYEAGCSGYVTKPIDKNELAQKMKDLLE